MGGASLDSMQNYGKSQTQSQTQVQSQKKINFFKRLYNMLFRR